MVHGRGTSGDSDSDITYFFHTALPWERLGRTISLASQGSCLQIAASPEPHAASLRFGRRQNTRHSGREGKKQSTAKVCLVYLGHTAGSLLVAKLQNSGLTQRAYKVKSTGLLQNSCRTTVVSRVRWQLAVSIMVGMRHAAQEAWIMVGMQPKHGSCTAVHRSPACTTGLRRGGLGCARPPTGCPVAPNHTVPRACGRPPPRPGRW
jgi:hypothetical protein